MHIGAILAVVVLVVDLVWQWLRHVI